jgi:NTE family protein
MIAPGRPLPSAPPMPSRPLKSPRLIRACKLQWCLWKRRRRLKARARAQRLDAPMSQAAPAPAAPMSQGLLAPAPLAAEPRAPLAQAPERAPRIALALQGGGSHGAFTWGVLHELLDAGMRWQAVSGTSAGAVNAAVMSCGYAQGGASGAQQALAAFWREVSEAGENVSLSPRFLRSSAPQLWDWWTQAWRQFSPYQFNPLNLNPLRDILQHHIDDKTLRGFDAWALLLCATQVRTGQPRIFSGRELGVDAVLASACLPMVFQAVKIGDEHYWDGGYSANPPIAPLVASEERFDRIVLVRIHVSQRREQPTNAADIMTRASEISFGAPLLAELRMLDAVRAVAARGPGKPLLDALPAIEVIEADRALQRFDADSKFDTDWAFLQELFALGRKAAAQWLATSAPRPVSPPTP